MKKLISLLVLVLICSTTFGALETSWIKWTGNAGTVNWATGANWLRYDNAQVAPVYWNPVYIGAEATAGSNITITVAANTTVATLKTYLGQSTDTAASCILNVSSGSTYYVGYDTAGVARGSGVFFIVGSKGAVNTNGSIIGWGVDINGGNVAVNTGGKVQSNTAYWYVRNGAKVTLNEGGIFHASNATAYGTGGSSGNIDICGGTFQLIGDKVSAVNDYITRNFLTAYGDTNDSKLQVVYDSVNNLTKVTAIPEPATMILLGIGSLVMLPRRRK
jgi:hypothetical protein